VPIVYAAVGAAAAGAAAMCGGFVIVAVAMSDAQPSLLFETIAAQPITFLVFFLPALVIFALPASIVFGIIAHAIAGCGKNVSARTCAMVGLFVGTAIFLAVLGLGAPIESLAGLLVAGGIAGAAGGWSFANSFNRVALMPGFELRSRT
jgi:hypothetical protein